MSGLCLGDGHIPCPGDGRFYLCLFSFRLSRRRHVRPMLGGWAYSLPRGWPFLPMPVLLPPSRRRHVWPMLGGWAYFLPRGWSFCFPPHLFPPSRRHILPFCRAWHALCPAKGVFIKAFFPRRAKGRFGRACPLAFPHKRWDNLPNTPFCFQRRPLL